MHLLCHHVAAVNTSMPMTDVKLHENLEIRYGIKKKRCQEKVSLCFHADAASTSNWGDPCALSLHGNNGKMANRSVASPEPILSFRADAPGNLPEICGSCANYPMDPSALHIYQTASAAQHKDKTPKTPQKPYYSPSGRTSTGPLMAIHIYNHYSCSREWGPEAITWFVSYTED